MSAPTRAAVASSYTLIKGAMISETYGVLAAWDFGRSKLENLKRLREENFIGAGSAAWLDQVADVLSRRLDPEGRDRALVGLAQRGCDLETWKPMLLWHITRDEFLLRDFLTHWLFPAYETGTVRIRTVDLVDYVRGIARRGARMEHEWTLGTAKRVAAGLLRISVDFGLLRGVAAKEFAGYHLPERSFLYLLHAMYEAAKNPRKVIESEDWRMFLMRPSDVERELLRLHQYRKLEYEVAGSLAQLRLPCATALEYAESVGP